MMAQFRGIFIGLSWTNHTPIFGHKAENTLALLFGSYVRADRVCLRVYESYLFCFEHVEPVERGGYGIVARVGVTNKSESIKCEHISHNIVELLVNLAGNVSLHSTSSMNSIFDFED
jgi:hypothetical protein